MNLLSGLAAEEGGGQLIALWASVVTIAGTIIAAFVSGGFGFAGKKKEVSQAGDAGLRDDQREFIQVLRNENTELRSRVTELEVERVSDYKKISALQNERVTDQRRIEALEQALRAAGIPIPSLS